MEIEDQVTSLELSKKLKELGVKQKSYFYWFKIVNFDNGVIQFVVGNNNDQFIYGNSGIWNQKLLFSAFTVSELGAILPNGAFTSKSYGLDGGYNAWREDNKGKILDKINGKTEADARAKMLIYLIEQKLLPIT